MMEDKGVGTAIDGSEGQNKEIVLLNAGAQQHQPAERCEERHRMVTAEREVDDFSRFPFTEFLQMELWASISECCCCHLESVLRLGINESVAFMLQGFQVMLCT